MSRRHWYTYAEERDILANPHRRASNSVLAVPMDRRAPKLRLLTRRAKDLLGQRLLVRVDRWWGRGGAGCTGVVCTGCCLVYGAEPR